MRKEIMSRYEFIKADQRIDEINVLLDMEIESDVLDSLQSELDAIIADFERSLKLARIKESGLILLRSTP